MLIPNTLPFSQRINNWLEILREERIKIRTKTEVDKDDKMMKQLLKMMTPLQMKGYLKGLTK